MIPKNRLQDYSSGETLGFLEVGTAIVTVLKNSKEIIQLSENVKQKVENPSNVISIAPNVKLEYEKLQNKEMEIHAIIEQYQRWVLTLQRVMHDNRERLHRKKIRKHVIEVFNVCASFPDAMKKITEKSQVPLA